MAQYQAGAIVLTGEEQIVADPEGKVRVWGLESALLPGEAEGLRLSAVLDRSARLFPDGGEGTVLITWPMANAWACGGIRGAVEAGWLFTHNTIGGWTTFRRPDRPVVHLGLVAELGAGNTSRLWSDGEPWDRVARRLAGYQRAVGAAYRMTPGVSGCASIRARYIDHKRGAQPWWGVGQRQSHGDVARGAGDLQRWEREPDLAETGYGWVHVYDANRARLAAAGNAELAWGRLTPTGAQPFDHRAAGYWRIRVEPKIEHLALGVTAPPLFNLADVDGGAVWLTTPVMRYLMDLGINPEVVDSRTEGGWASGQPGFGGTTAKPGKRILRGWAADLDHAVTEASASPQMDGQLVWSLKATYREVFGMMAREGGSVYRWDWSDTVLDLGRVNLLRRALDIWRATKTWPLRFHTDALYYASDEPDPRRAFPQFPEGTRLGQFKLSTIPMAEWMDGRRK